MDSQPTAATLQRRLIVALALAGLFLLTYRVLFVFLVPVAWAGIMAYVSWPLYARLRSRLGGRDNLSALLMTMLVAIVLVLPLIWVVLMLDAELTMLYQKLSQRVGQGPMILPPFLHNLPVVGSSIEDFINSVDLDSDTFSAQLRAWGEMSLHHLGGIADLVGKNVAKMMFSIFTVFFFYRDGETVVDQVRTVLRRVLGGRVDGYLAAMGSTTRAVLYGLGLTALVQGVLAGLGYWLAGVPSPVFLGMLTMVIALIPFGPLLAWGSVWLWLLSEGRYLPAFGLLLWGVVVVSWVDNFVRPMVISSASRIPFLLVLFGVLGGLGAFGMIGLFLGPVILAVAMAVWREWVEETAHGDQPSA